MRILVLTNMYPSPGHPLQGTFVFEQVGKLREHPRIAKVDVRLVDGSEKKSRYLRAASTLRRDVRLGSYDLVHAHYGLTGAVGVSQRNLPVVVTYHGSDLSVRWQQAVSRFAARRSAANICVSRAMRERLGSPSVHLPCSIDAGAFTPRSRDKSRRAFGVVEPSLALLFPASAKRRVKRYDRFSLVADILRCRGHSVHELHLDEVPRDQVPSLMAAADAMILTSESEGTPVAIMEAMACGLPVVATRVGDVPIMLEDPDRSRVLDFDGQRFAAAVECVVSDAERSPAPGSHKYDHAEVIERIVETYSRVLRQGSPTRVAAGAGL